MKRLQILILFIFPFFVLGQPIGKLFINTGFVSNNELGYIQYPQNQYHSIDSIDVDDMLIVNNKLLVSNAKIYIYDIATLSKTDSINNTDAYMLAYENNKLAVSRTQPPYFEVYDFTTKNLLFSLNTNKIKSMPVDILLDMDKAYLLFDTSIVIVDLNLQDTIATKAVFSNYSYPAYNQYLINYGNKIYIDTEIATGAPRFSIFSLDKTTHQIQQELFYEFVDTPFEPILAENKMYMSFFPSYYDITADTFMHFQNSYMFYPLCFDDISNSFFLYKPTNFKVSYFYNNTYSPEITVPTYINKAVYLNEAVSVTPELIDITNNISIYPNPANKEVNIQLPNEEEVKEIRMIAINGVQTVKSINKTISQRKIDISQLADGMYFVEIVCKTKTYKTRFIKSSINK
ncbi:MAG: T9SS type A sorting domain-containing protein [Bacteroidales bacterium]